jgi:CHAD domain-containing protein
VQARAQRGWSEIHANLDSDRYAALVTDLEVWRSDPPYTERAAAPATKVKKYIKAANAKLDKRLQLALAAAAAGHPEVDELFHSARKAGKRARYAVELALPLWGEKAEQIIAERKGLQDVLGEHQDSIVSAQFLREQGIRSGNRSGHNGFTYGLLYAQQLARAASVGEQLKPFL